MKELLLQRRNSPDVWAVGRYSTYYRWSERMGGATVITVRATKAGSLFPLTQNRSQPPSNETVHVAKR
jgi:hypothetical protein